MSTCKYMYTWALLQVYLHVYIHVYMTQTYNGEPSRRSFYVHTCVHEYSCIHEHMYAHVFMRTLAVLFMCIHISACTCVFVCVFVCVIIRVGTQMDR